VQSDNQWQLLLPVETLLAWLWQRWELEVAHREMRGGFGVGEKQCWHPPLPLIQKGHLRTLFFFLFPNLAQTAKVKGLFLSSSHLDTRKIGEIAHFFKGRQVRIVLVDVLRVCVMMQIIRVQMR